MAKNGRVYSNFKRISEPRLLHDIDSTRREGDVNLNGRYRNSGFDKVSVKLGKDGGFCYSFGTERR